jgi:23S rRNA pseudouridine1911/1915/1917 synthase
MERIVVPRTARGLTLLRFLMSARHGLAEPRARALANAGSVRLDGKPVRPARKLWGGEALDIDWPSPEKVAPVEGPPIPVLYADDHVLVVDKPAGIVVEREGTTPSVVALIASREEGLDVGGQAEPGVVHRLDRETSGCLLLAKHDRAVGGLKSAFEQKLIEKSYSALVLGVPADTHRIDTVYGRSPDDARRFTTRVSSARKASLSFVVRERFPDAAWLDVTLETGRTHQIRVQLAESGWAVLGDSLYGPVSTRTHPAAVAVGRQALHSRRIVFPHPITGERLVVEAPLPADFLTAVDVLRGGVAQP